MPIIKAVKGCAAKAETLNLRCLPLPGEFSRGHTFRLAHLRQQPREVDFNRTVAGQVTDEVTILRRVTIGLAMTCGMSADAYVQRYSVCQFRWLIHLEGRTSTPWAWNRPDCLKAIHSDAYLCRQCVRDDLTTRGYSTWRRIHQVPGIHWCPEHGNALEVVIGVPGFWSLPHWLMSRTQSRQHTKALRPDRHPFLQRYALAAQRLLDLPWDAGRWFAVLDIIAATYGTLRTTPRATYMPKLLWLTNKARRAAPALWLDALRAPGTTHLLCANLAAVTASAADIDSIFDAGRHH